MSFLRFCPIVLRSVLMSMVLLFGSLSASAHEIRPTIGDVEVSQEQVTLTLRIAVEPLLAGINLDAISDTGDAPEVALYNRFRAMPPADLEEAVREAWPRIGPGFLIESGGRRILPLIEEIRIPEVGDLELPRESTLVISAPLPPSNAPVSIGLAPGYGTFVPRQVSDANNAYEGFLAGGEMTPPLPRSEVLTESAGSVFLRYIGAGFEHIIPLGLDHILFVLGLFFFATQFRPLLFQVTAFTVAHTITLGLAATHYVSIPAGVVEPLIAASIVYVGVENTLGWGQIRGRTALVFAFGLLHGLGFANVLDDYGIAADRFVTALIGFNIGVEIGQLAVIAMAFAVVGSFMKKDWYRRAIAVPASLIIAGIGAYWFVERTFF